MAILFCEDHIFAPHVFCLYKLYLYFASEAAHYINGHTDTQNRHTEVRTE